MNERSDPWTRHAVALGTRLLGILALSILTLAPFASPAAAQTEWEAAARSGSAEFLLYGLLRDRPRDYQPFALGVARELALTKRPGQPAYIARRFVRLSPALAWDENINGGIAGETISIGTIPFTVAEESRAVAGVVTGFDGSAGIDFAVGDGVLLTNSAALSWRVAPEEDLTWGAATLRSCASRPTAPWQRIEGCASLRYVERDLSETFTRRVSVTHQRMLATGFGIHRLSLGPFAEDRSDVLQRGVTVDFDTARAGLGLIGASLSLGEPVEGRSAIRRFASLRLARDMLGAATSLSVSAWAEDGAILGQDRRDTVYAASITRALGDNLSVTVGGQTRRSNIDTFDEDTLTLGFNFRGFRR